MTNEVFQGSRFWAYFKYDFTQMWRNHVKAAIGIGFAGLIAYFVVVLFNLTFGDGWQGPGIAGRFVVFGVAAAALELYYTRIYGYLTDKRKGSAWLMLPASSFEKWLSMLIMAAIVLPVLFLCASFLVDSVLCMLDPSLGDSMLSVIGGGWQSLMDAMTNVNTDYTLTLNIAPLGWAMVMSLIGNLLYFLLCGICFKRNKILGAFVIAFGFSMLSSIVVSFFNFGFMNNLDVDDMMVAQANINHFFNWINAMSILFVVICAGGIFWRIKTIKH